MYMWFEDYDISFVTMLHFDKPKTILGINPISTGAGEEGGLIGKFGTTFKYFNEKVFFLS